MNVDVRLRDLEEAEELKTLIERRLAFAIDRFAGRVQSIQVLVADVNGPRGGVDKLCFVYAVLAGGHSVTIEERASSPATAASRAIRRLAAALGRVIPRKRRPVSAVPAAVALAPLAC